MSLYIVYPCDHVICGCYYVCHFNLMNNLQFNSYNKQCPGCIK